MIRPFFYLLLILSPPFLIKAQEVKPPTQTQVQNAQLKTAYKEPFEKKREVVFNNKRYKIYNNYVSGGDGRCYNSGWKELEFCPTLDFNFHIQKQYFQVGGLLAGPHLGANNCVQVHACWGYRYERSNYMLAAYGGLSYTGGYYLPPDSTTQIPFKSVGAYIALQCFYKIKFDYGVGLTGFIDCNTTQVLSGIRLEVFFSGAYRGLKRNIGKDHEAEVN